MSPCNIKHLLVSLLLGFTLLLTGAANAQEPIVLKLGHVDNPASHSGIGADAFAAEVDRLSGGKLKIEVFHSGKLGNIPTQITNVFSGAQDMHLIYPEFLASFIDQAKVISLPYVFDSLEHLQKFYTSALWQPAIDKIDAQGAVLLDRDWSWWIHDPRGFIATRPIFTPEELTGLKLRIWEAKPAIATWQGLGANTVVVPRPEMYLAFKQKIIEGGPETIGISYDQKNVEMAKYWIRTEEYYQIINIMMTKSKYESLPEELQDVLHQAMTTAGTMFREESLRGFTEKKDKAKAEYGVSVIEPALDPWRKKGEGVITQLEDEGFIPKGFVAEIRALNQ